MIIKVLLSSQEFQSTLSMSLNVFSVRLHVCDVSCIYSLTENNAKEILAHRETSTLLESL